MRHKYLWQEIFYLLKCGFLYIKTWNLYFCDTAKKIFMMEATFSPLRIFTNLDGHGRKIRKGLEEHYKKGLYTDFTVILANGKRIPCHKTILAINSTFFSLMFTSGDKMVEGIRNEVKLDLFDSYCAEAIVEYFYSGTMVVPWEKIKEMVNAAEFLQVNEIKSRCDEFIMWKVKNENAQEWYSFACQFQLPKTKAFLHQNFVCEISESNEFLELPITEFACDFKIEPDGSNSSSYLYACLKWVRFDFQSRKHCLHSIKHNITKHIDVSSLLKHIDTIFGEEEKHDLATYLPGLDDLHVHTRKKLKSVLIVGMDQSNEFTWQQLFKKLHATDENELSDDLCDSMSFTSSDVCDHNIESYNICAVPNGFVTIGGGIPYKADYLIPQAFCHYVETTRGPYRRDIPLMAVPPMDSARCMHGCEFIGNKVYVFGGCTRDPRDVKPVLKICMDITWKEWSSSVQALDFSTMDWQPRSHMPVSMINPKSFVINQELYVIGKGMEISQTQDFRYTPPKTVFLKYDTWKNEWEELAKPQFNLDESRNRVYQGAVYKDNFYLAVNNTHVSCIVSYDTKDKTWAFAQEGPKELHGSVIFELGGILFCIATDRKCESELWELCITQDRWKKCKRLTLYSFEKHDSSSFAKAIVVDGYDY